MTTWAGGDALFGRDGTDQPPTAARGERRPANAGRVVCTTATSGPAPAPDVEEPEQAAPEPTPSDPAEPVEVWDDVDAAAPQPAPAAAIAPPVRFAVPAPPARPLPPRPDARPRVEDDTSIIGLSRVSRSKVGSRLFTWFFVMIFALIVVQMVVALLNPY